MKTNFTFYLKRFKAIFFLAGLLFALQFSTKAQPPIDLDPLWDIWEYEHGIDFETYTESGKHKYYVTWASGGPGWGHNIYRRRLYFNKWGSLIFHGGLNVVINKAEAQEPVTTAIQRNGNRILSVWEDGYNSIANSSQAVDIYGRLHWPNGGIINGKSNIKIAGGIGAQHSPVVGYLNNRFLVFYGEDEGVPATKIMMKALDHNGNIRQTLTFTPNSQNHWWPVFAANNAGTKGLAVWVKNSGDVWGSVVSVNGSGHVTKSAIRQYMTEGSYVYNRVIWLEKIQRYAVITKKYYGNTTVIALVDQNGNRTKLSDVAGGIIQEAEPAFMWDAYSNSYILVYPTGTNKLVVARVNNSTISYHQQRTVPGISWKKTGIKLAFVKDERGMQAWGNNYKVLITMGIYGTDTDAWVEVHNIPTNIFSQYSSHHLVNAPGTVQAEHYFRMSGVVKETCNDSGGGQDVGSIHYNDWMEYKIRVRNTGTYKVTFRMAAPHSGNSSVQLLLNGANIGYTSLASTGGWQTWRSRVDYSVKLKAGVHILRVRSASSKSFNLNWIKFEYTSSALRTSGGEVAQADEAIEQEVEEKLEIEPSEIGIYPNPAQNKFYVNTGISSGVNQIKMYNLMGELIVEAQLQDGEAIDISSYKKGVYLVNVNNTINRRLVKE